MRIFVVGYYGFGLVSDDAVLQSLVDDLRRIFGGAEISVTALRQPGVTGVDVVPISSFSAIVAEIERSDLVLIGGGGVYNEDNNYNPTAFLTPRQQFNDLCAAVPVLCVGAEKPCVIVGVGVFSIHNRSLAERVQQAFRSASAATLRDKGSLQNLLVGSSRNIRAIATADPVFRLAPREPATPIAEFVSAERRIVVSLRHWNLRQHDTKGSANDWEQEVAAALDRFLAEHDSHCFFLPFQNEPELGPFSDDVPVMRRVQELMAASPRTTLLPVVTAPAEMAWYIAQSDMALCTRYHSLIMAIAQAKPVVAIGYSEKIANTLLDMKRQGVVVPLDGLTRDRLFASLHREYSGRHRQAAARQRQARRQFDIAGINVDCIRRVALANKVGKIDPNYAVSLLGSAVRRAVAMEEMITSTEPQSDAALRVRYARWLADDNPDDADAQLSLGRLLVERHSKGEGQPGDVERADQYLSKALELGADSYWTRYYRAAARLHLGRYDQALEDIGIAGRLRPDRSDWASIKYDAEAALRAQTNSHE